MSLCPLDGTSHVAAAAHMYDGHDPCACLDLHHWLPVPGTIGAHRCSRCNAARCPHPEGVHRCNRREGHGGPHVFR